MTPTELLEMLKGWPVDARPVNHWATVVGTQQHAGVDSMHIDHAVDLACMAGVRWLIANGCVDRTGTRVLELGLFTDGEWNCADGCAGLPHCKPDKPDDAGGFGPTLLHAIDAAIRATK